MSTDRRPGSPIAILAVALLAAACGGSAATADDLAFYEPFLTTFAILDEDGSFVRHEGAARRARAGW